MLLDSFVLKAKWKIGLERCFANLAENARYLNHEGSLGRAMNNDLLINEDYTCWILSWTYMYHKSELVIAGRCVWGKFNDHVLAVGPHDNRPHPRGDIIPVRQRDKLSLFFLHPGRNPAYY